LLVHRVSLGELYYLAASGGGEKEAERLLADLRKLPWDTAGPLGFDLLRAASRLKVDHRVPYVDAIAGAWALVNDAALATTDRRGFERAAKSGALEVLFLR
jgi:predicted nucleic acid-binding protein